MMGTHVMGIHMMGTHVMGTHMMGTHVQEPKNYNNQKTTQNECFLNLLEDAGECQVASIIDRSAFNTGDNTWFGAEL